MHPIWVSLQISYPQFSYFLKNDNKNTIFLANNTSQIETLQIEKENPLNAVS